MKTIIAAILILSSTVALSDKPSPAEIPGHINLPPANSTHTIYIEPCNEYQIRVITTRGNNSIDAETLGYCDLEQAQNVLAQLNASAYRKLPKGQPIYQIAYPLF